MFTLPDGLPLRYGAAEPVLETRRADARVIAGSEALIIHRCAEIPCVGVCDHRRFPLLLEVKFAREDGAAALLCGDVLQDSASLDFMQGERSAPK